MQVEGCRHGLVQLLRAVSSVTLSYQIPDSEGAAPQGEGAAFSASQSLGDPLVPAATGTAICAAQVCPGPCPTWGLRTLG